MNQLQQVRKLLRVKELREKLSEAAVMRARGECMQASQAVQAAKNTLEELQVNGKAREKERLDALLNAPDNVSVQSARIKNVYTATKREIEQTLEIIASREFELMEAMKRLKLKQKELAQKLQECERTRKLCDHLAQNEELEEMRRA